METEPETEFEFFLAAKLGRTVAELQAGLSNVEWVGWQVYYGRKAQRDELAMSKAGGGR
jgi:hypothetical protein